MIKNKYLLMAAAAMSVPFILAWTFNHVNPWLAFGVALFLVLLINNYFTTNKNNNQK